MRKASTVFITGTGRSGTNVTKSIFAKHSLCATLPFEYRFSVDPNGIVDFLNQYSSTWSPFMADKRLRELENYLLNLAQRNEFEYKASNWLRTIDTQSEKITPFSYAGWELEKWFPGYRKYVEALFNHLVDYKYTASWPGSDSLSENNRMYFGSPKTKAQLTTILSEFLASCFNSYLNKTKKKVFIEDNTWSLLYADDLLKLVPSGKILHVIRDPRDVISSLMKQRWAPSNVDQLLTWYQSILSIWKSQKNELNDNQFLEIKLEDLISDTEVVLKNTCAFIGIEYEVVMTQIDLSKSNSNRYKKELSTGDIHKIENALSDILIEYDY